MDNKKEEEEETFFHNRCDDICHRCHRLCINTRREKKSFKIQIDPKNEENKKKTFSI
jgi:hypothetical protein